MAAVLAAGSEKAAAHRLDLSHSTVKHHLAARWPWAMGFASALARVRAIPLRA